MRLKFDDLVERARRRDEEKSVTTEAMRVLATLPPVLWREWLRAHLTHATSAMAIALAKYAQRVGSDALSVLDDAEEIATMLCDGYDGPYARYVVWSTRGAVLHELERYSEAMIAFERAGAALDDAPDVFAAPFRADLALGRAALLMEMCDPVAARQSAWAAAEWYAATGERAGLARIAMIVVIEELFAFEIDTLESR